MFQSIEYIKDYGIFRDYPATEREAVSFAARNLIYGWNYSGKTTLSRVLRSFERGKHHPDFSSGTFRLRLADGTTFTHGNLQDLPFPVRVFNSDYVRENLQWQDGVDPIFILGEERISLQEELRLLDRWIRRREEFVEVVQARKTETQSHLDSEATRAAKHVREQIGRTPFNRRPHLQSIIDDLGREYSQRILGEEERRAEFQKLNAEKRARVSKLSLVPDLKGLPARVSVLLNRKATQKVLDRLRQNSDVERWVEQGLPLHQNSKTCHFCDQQLPDGLLERLGRHFSEELHGLKNDLRKCLTTLKEAQLGLDFPDKVQLYPDLQAGYETIIEEIDRLVEKESEWLRSLIELVERKLVDPSKKAPQDVDSEVPFRGKIRDAIERANSIIKTHNKRCVNFEKERSAAETRLVKDRAATYMDEVEYFKKMAQIDDLSDRAERSQDRITELELRREKVEVKVSEEVKGAEVVNEYLRQYFGTAEITAVVTEDDKYILSREGQPARNLSEGEKTAIAFSYFLTTLEARELVDEKPVVYIDDPVSSLDANHLFSIFATIKSIAEQCRQLFVSTHNFGFFRLMKGDRFFQEIVNRKRRSSWLLVRRNDDRGAELIDLPNSLRKFNSEYHYLFDLVVRFCASPDEHDQLRGMMPNILRRLLEIYSSFRIPNTAMDLSQRLARLCDDAVMRNQVYKFVNHGSHSDSLEFGVEFPQSGECLQVAKNVLRLIEEADENHYGSMMKLIEDG